MTIMISANHLNKCFGHIQAVDDISLTVSRGEVLGLLGPNGSGKSTTMKMLTGFLIPTRGSVEICGTNMLTNNIEAQRQLGYLPEGAPAYDDISTSVYLNFIADIRHLTGAAKKQAIEYAVARTDIHDVLHQPIGTLSKGYKRRVGLAQALLHNPPVLILDEPTDGLDPNQKHEVRTLIREISQDKAIIISTHILEEVESLCDRTTIITDGRVVADGTPGDFEKLSRFYNAVSISLPSGNASEVRRILDVLPEVASVETKVSDAQFTELTVLPEKGQTIIANIADLSRQKNWPTEQIFVKQGHLEEVFRNVTTEETISVDRSVKNFFDITPDESGSTQLRDIWSVAKRELIAYFSTPVAYVFIVTFLIALGALTFFLGHFFSLGQANLDPFFQFHPWLYLFFIPAIAMRLWAEERKSGSIEMLLTLPVTIFATVLGKFLAAWVVIGLGLMLSSTMWITVNYLGSPDNGAIATAYVGSFFIAGGYLAISSFVSALTQNQVIAFIISIAICFVFTASGLSVVLEFFSGWASPLVLDAVTNFSFLGHFRDISRGVIDLRDVVFFVSTITVFLFANVLAVEIKKNA
jgi:ABC-2 type transport system ATP-binding protein